MTNECPCEKAKQFQKVWEYYKELMMSCHMEWPKRD